jgi:Fe2+ transport system protein FeoA
VASMKTVGSMNAVGFIRRLSKPVADAWRRPAGLVLAVLAGCFVLASAADARTDLAVRTHALQAMIAKQPPGARTVTATADLDQVAGASLGTAADNPSATPAPSAQLAGALDADTQAAYSALAGATDPPPLEPVSKAWASLVGPTLGIVHPAAAAIPPHGQAPQMQFFYLQGYATHARLLAGAWPRIVTGARSRPPTAALVQVALPETVMRQLGLHVGSTFQVQAVTSLPPPPITIQVTGAYQPIDPADVYWQTQPADAAPQLTVAGIAQPYLLDGALLGQTEINPLALTDPFGPGVMAIDWNIPLDVSGLNAQNVDTLSDALNAALPQATLTVQTEDFGAPQMAFLCPIAGTLAQFEAEQQAGQMETAMPAVSLAVVGIIALLLAARGAVDRRAGEDTVLRARGAPLRRLGAGAAGRAAVTVVPLAAAALGIAALLPGQTPPGLWRDEILLPAVAVAVPCVMTILRHRRTVTDPAASPRTPGQELARRIVLQAALAALCFFGLDEARSQGLSPNGGINLFTACAPLLAAVLAALVALNLGPPVLRTLLRTADGRRGAVGLLGLARTARASAPAAVTVFVLTLVLATADITVALHGTDGKEGAAAASAAAIFKVANISGESTYANPALFGPDAMESATAGHLTLLAALAVAAGCLVVALGAAGDARERRGTMARLATMGLTAGQARAVTAVELLGPIALAAAAGTAVAAPLLWAVRPALAQALGGADARITAATLSLPVAALAVLALAAGLAAAGAARRGTARALRLGDSSD